jgi:cystathionine beta-synthase
MPERNRTPYDSILDTIGWTPLIRLNQVTRGVRAAVYGKAEFFNPGGSVKDRIGMPIIERAEREGRLKPGGTIVEGTSGNTGVGLAIAAALKGYRCIFTMPDKMSQEKVRLLKAFGAEVIITPTAVPPDHPDHYVVMAKRIAEETPNAILANQFYNDATSKSGTRRSRSSPAIRSARSWPRCGAARGRANRKACRTRSRASGRIRCRARST